MPQAAQVIGALNKDKWELCVCMHTMKDTHPFVQLLNDLHRLPVHLRRHPPKGTGAFLGASSGAISPELCNNEDISQ